VTIEVDMHYIKGMLNNPDTAPSARIVSILTFHFKLQHVPGKLHGPDCLSHQPCQEEDNNNNNNGEDPEEFDDWVDNLYGFVHLINPAVRAPCTTQPLHIFASQIIDETGDLPPSQPKITLNYNIIQCNMSTMQADKRLKQVHNWLTFFKWPDGMADHKYELLTCYAASFFVDNSIMWRHDDQGAHKHILYCNHCIEAISAAHDNVGHCGYYATHALVAERYWWPFVTVGWP
jgi:hypothetical protein